MGAPIIAMVIFDTNGSGVYGDYIQGKNDLITASNRNGEFGRDAIGRQSPNLPPATATVSGRVSGVSTYTGFIYTDIIAPLDAAIYSPATSLLGTVSDDAIPANLGLQMTAQELGNFDAYTELGSSDPVRQAKARRVTALNLKLLAYAGLETTDSGSVTNAIAIHRNLGAVRAQILAGPVDLNASNSTLQVMGQSPRATFTNDAGREAAARLLARYGQAVDQYLTSSRHIGDVEYGLRLKVLPILDSLMRTGAPSAGQLAQADNVTVAELVGFFTQMSQISPIPAATGKFVAVADWRAISGVTRMYFPSGCANTSSFVCNDVDLTVASALNVQTIQVVAVRVPSQYSAFIAASLQPDGNVEVTRLDSTTRLVWLEYDARDRDGLTSTARAYFLLNQP
ncbi:MAG: hypothetical protein ACK5NN_15200 [Sphingomonadaceae bacterium]